MHLCSVVVRDWKTTVKTVLKIFSLFVIVLILSRPLDALQTALLRASDGNVYQIRFPSGDLSSGYNTSDFIDEFSIYDETGQVELCPGNDQPVTRELYTAARVLAQTPRSTPLFDTSPLADILIQTAADFHIDEEGNIDVIGIVGEIVEEMVVDEIQGHIQTLVDPSLNLGVVSINLNTFNIKFNASGPAIIVKPTEFLSRLVGDEIELRWMLYAFSRASTYANTTIHLQALANQRAAALWDAINAGEVVDITGHAFTIDEASIEISDAIGVFDSFRLRLAAGVYRAYAEYVANLGTNLAEHEGAVEVLANRISIDIITEFLLTLSAARSAIAEKDALDELDAQIPGDINTRLHANINSIYDSATSDLTQHGFCTPDLRFTAIPPTVPEGDTLIYTVALNSAPAFVAIITISSDNPDVTVSPTSLTFTPNNWYIPKRTVVAVSADADSIDESVSLRHIVAGYGGGLVQNIQFDITDHVSEQLPEAVGTVPTQNLTVPGPTRTVDVAPYFSSQSNLIYEVVSNPRGIVDTSISGSRVTITPIQEGSPSVVVTAFDRDDRSLSAVQTIPVTVRSNSVTIVRPPSDPTFRPPTTSNPIVEGLDDGTEIIVQNTGTAGVNIRSNPRVSNFNPDNRIGKVYDGATGTITDGPERNGEFRWWKVDWDRENIEGWSVEAYEGSQLLFPRPPDLEVQFNVSDDKVEPGERFTIEATVRNNGPGESAATEIFFYYQKSGENTPHVAGSGKRNVPSLPAGESSEKLSLSVEAPMIPGDYVYGAVLPPDIPNGYDEELVDPTREIRLNNTEHEDVEVTSSPDLIVESISANKSTVDPGEEFRLEAVVRNQGIGEPSRNATLRYYRSRDARISESDTEVGDDTVTRGNLDTNESDDEFISLTAPIEPGVYYYGACVDLRFESNTRNNCSSAVAITVRETGPSDLVVSTPILNATTLSPGQSFTLTTTVRNQGVGPAPATTLRGYLSPNANISDVDTEVGTVAIGFLASNTTQTVQLRVEAPLAAGTSYYGVCVDQASNESNTVNNCSTGVALTVENLAPTAPGTPPSQTLVVGDVSEIDITPYFSDPNEDTLTYTVSSSAVEIIAVEMSGVSVSYLKMTPLAAGTATVTIEAADPSGLSLTQSFSVTVNPPPNRAPVAIGTLPNQTLMARGASRSVDVSRSFHDVDGDTLRYTARSDNPRVLSVTISGTQVTLIPEAEGSATVTVTASDGQLTAALPISVFITPYVDAEAWMPDATLRAAVRTALGIQPNDVLTQQAMQGLIILNAASNQAGTGVQDITGLEHATQLSILNLGRTGVQDLTPLQGLTQLTQLTLWYTNIWDLSPLQGLTNLTHLNLHQTAPRSISPLQGLINLTSLDIGRTRTSDLTPISRLTALTDLNLSFNNLNDLTLLGNLTTLTSLNLGYTTPSDITPLKDLTALTYLNLKNNQISDIAPLSGLTQLIWLYLEGNQISNVSPLEGLTSLQFLFLKYNPIADTAPLQRLKQKNPNLSIDIDISPPNKAPVDVGAIPPQTLTVDGGVGTVDIERYFNDPDNTKLTYTAVSNNTSIATVSVRGRTVFITPVGVGSAIVTVTASDGELTATQTFSVLGTVAVSAETWMPDENLRAAVRSMLNLAPNDALTPQKMTGLTGLGATASQIKDLTGLEHATNLRWLHAGIHQISDLTPLAELTALTDLTLKDNQISDLTPLAGLTALTRLNLENNQLNNSGILPLTGLTVLTELYLGNNQISDLTPLAGLTALTKLGLSDNQISDITPLAGLTALLQLWLERNKISDVSPLEALTSLRFLHLAYNPIADVAPLQRLKEKNPNLSIIDVDIETEGADLFVDAVRVNKNTVSPGKTFRLETTIKNDGEADASGITVRYYQSTDATISTTDAELNTRTLRLIVVDGMTEPWAQLTAPETPGVYYYGVCIDEVVGESDTSNNCSGAVAITVRDPAPEPTVENRAPSAIGTLPPQTLSENSAPTVVDVAQYFNDPDNTALTYTAVSDNTAVVMTQIRGSEVTITPVSTGHATVTVTASDGELTATQTFSITVMEARTPDLRVKSVSVDKNSVVPGEAFRFNAVIENRGEADSIATPLRYYLSTDNTISDTDTQVYATILPIVIANATSEPSVELTAPDTPGVYYYGICVDAVDDESDTTNNCSVAVAITVENRAPISVGTLPSRTFSENDAPVVVDIAAYFNDPDKTALTYTAASDNTAVVLVQMNGSAVTITPVSAGNATVTVTASDGTLTATQTLSVSVVAAPTENQAPVAIGVIPVQSLTVDGAPSTVDISAYFSDANGDPLTYAAWPDDKSVVGLRREGTLLTITAKAAGSATVTVRARDPAGLQAFQRISVFVSTTEVLGTELPAETWMPDANLRAAVRDALGLRPNDALTQQTIQELTSLRYLGPDLSDNQKITRLTGLEYALNLEHLDLYAHLISDLRPLAGLAKLRSLWLAGNKITNIRPLTSLPLEVLDLGGNPINDFAPLAELTGLTRLDFARNGLGDTNLHLITGLTQLTHLDLRSDQISDITSLAALTALTFLDLGYNQITDITSLTKLVNLNKLQLEGNPISDTALLLDLTSQNPNLEIDIEIGEEPPSEPDTEIETEVPDLMVASIRVDNTAVDPGDIFRLDAVIRNQGKATSEAGKVHFYRSLDETITTEDTKVRTSDMPSLAADRTKNRWARLTAPDTAGVYYYGVCMDGVADESDTENNCSTAIKITVGTVGVKPPVVERPTTDPESGEDPPQADLLAKQVFQKHSKILRRQDVKAVLPDVLTALKDPEIQPLLIPATIELVVEDPDLLKKTVPTISDRFIVLLKTDAAIKALLSDPQVQKLLQTPAAIDELAKLLGISVAPPTTADGVVTFRDANLAKKVREALNLPTGASISKVKLVTLTQLVAEHQRITDLTGLESATALTGLFLWDNSISNISLLSGLTSLEALDLNGNEINDNDLNVLSGLTSLYHLELTNNSISDLRAISGLTSLESLMLRFNLISDLRAISGLTRLRRLGLNRNLISDISLLSGLTSLEMLDLQDNSITDVSSLQGLTSLRVLLLEGNPGITDFQPLQVLRTTVEAQGVTVVDNLGSADLAGYPQEVQAAQRNYVSTGRAKPVAGYLLIDVNIGVSAAAPSGPVLPDETALLPNYPNPFNPETWIPYQLAKAVNVTLTIYDVRGVVVRQLALGHRSPGFYYGRGRAAHWDGRNEIGEKVASGLYFYTFTAGDFTATQKLLIRK